MGLDNGIILNTTDFVPEQLDFPEEVEICYWRKEWELRNKIMDKCGFDEDDSCGEYTLTIENINTIISILQEMSASYFSNDIESLKWLVKYITNNPDVEAIFYDSY